MEVLTDSTLAEKIDFADKICAKLCPYFKFFCDYYGRRVIFPVFANGFDHPDNPMFLRKQVLTAISIKDFTEMTLEQIEEFVLLCSMEHTFTSVHEPILS